MLMDVHNWDINRQAIDNSVYSKILLWYFYNNNVYYNYLINNFMWKSINIIGMDVNELQKTPIKL